MYLVNFVCLGIKLGDKMLLKKQNWIIHLYFTDISL